MTSGFPLLLLGYVASVVAFSDANKTGEDSVDSAIDSTMISNALRNPDGLPDWLDLSSRWRPNAKLHGDDPRWQDGKAHSFLTNTQNAHCKDIHRADCEDYDAFSRLFWGQVDGTVIELGGLNGIRSTKSQSFANLANWRRIVIEGDPSWRASRKQKLIAQQADVAGVTAPICKERRQVHYLHHKILEVQGIAEFMSTTFLQHWYPGFEMPGQAAELSGKAGIYSFTRLTCLPLTEILQALNVTHVNFLILDVEGAELQVLESIDWDAITIDALAVRAHSAG